MNTKDAAAALNERSADTLARVALALEELAAALGMPTEGRPTGETAASDRLEAAAPWLSAALPVLAELVRLVQPETAGERLTPREREVLELLVRGLTDREIAARLYISHHTAETHVKRIRAKLGGGSRAATVARVLGATEFPPPYGRGGANAHRPSIPP